MDQNRNMRVKENPDYAKFSKLTSTLYLEQSIVHSKGIKMNILILCRQQFLGQLSRIWRLAKSQNQAKTVKQNKNDSLPIKVCLPAHSSDIPNLYQRCVKVLKHHLSIKIKWHFSVFCEMTRPVSLLQVQ